LIPLAAKKFEIIDNYKGREGFFTEGFTLDDTRNKNGWRTTWEAIKLSGMDSIGRPGIEFLKCVGSVCDRDHTNGITYKENMSVQELFRESNIIDAKFDESTHTMTSIDEILSNDFVKKIETEAVKFISPSIWPIQWEKVGEEDGRDLIDVHRFRFLHRAYIDDPAFGEKARIYTTCSGHGSKCKLQFNASLSADAGSNNISHIQEIPIITRHLGKLMLSFEKQKCTPCQNAKLNYKMKKIQSQLKN